MKKAIIAFSLLFAGLLSTQLNSQAQTLGLSTVSDVAKTLGNPQFDDGSFFKGYIDNGNIIGIAYDDKNICQAVVLYKIHGDPVTKAEASKLDALVLPFGDYKFIPIPVSLVKDLPANCTMHDGWLALNGNSYLVVADAAYSFETLNIEARLYATDAGSKLLNQLGPNSGVSGWAPQAGKKAHL